MANMSATDSAIRDAWYRRAASVGHWLRDTGLGMFGVSLLGLVAASGWGGSTLGLRDFAATHMGYTGMSAWLVPATFDGASVGLSIAAFRAAIHGRGAAFTRIGIVAFTSLSSWMNYEHITDTAGRRIAALLPIAGVALLESLLSEARRAYERRHGYQQRPRIHPLRILFDWSGTWAIFRSVVLAVPLPERIAQHATIPTQRNAATSDTATDTDTSAIPRATVTPIDRSRSVGVSGGAKQAAMRAAWERHVAAGTTGDLSGKSLADEVGASEALGRRYLAVWKQELVDSKSAGGAR